MAKKPDFYIEGIPVFKDFLSPSLPNYTGYKMTPEGIVIHETENHSKGANAEMHNRYLHNGAGGRSASWHFTVDDNSIYWHIPLNRNGWHAGDGAYGRGNRKWLGIEHCENSDGDFRKTVQNGMALVRWIYKELNKKLPVEPHRTFSSWNKNCPSNILPRWNEYHEAIGNPKLVAPVPVKAEKEKVHSNEEYHGNSIVDYLNHNKMDSSFANRKRLAQQHRISNYSGTAAQNMELLAKIRGGEPSRIEDNHKGNKKSVSTIAQEVIDGKWGNNPQRRQRLNAAGYNYNTVQSEVEKILRGSERQVQSKSIDALAREVLDGLHGNGEARKRSLGSKYSAVQKRVNELANATTKPRKSIDQMAREVINHPKAPNGHAARQKWLNVDNATYQKVRRRINQILK